MVAVVAEPPAPPPPRPPPQIDAARVRWITSLVDGVPRGTVAADESFGNDLAHRVEELSATSESSAFEDSGGFARDGAAEGVWTDEAGGTTSVLEEALSGDASSDSPFASASIVQIASGTSASEMA